jgi:hypothetical protein
VQYSCNTYKCRSSRQIGLVPSTDKLRISSLSDHSPLFSTCFRSLLTFLDLVPLSLIGLERDLLVTHDPGDIRSVSDSETLMLFFCSCPSVLLAGGVIALGTPPHHPLVVLVPIYWASLLGHHKWARAT